jgi:death-on-curing family protein
MRRNGLPTELRDPGLFESALAAPQAGFGGYDPYPGLFDKAAVLMRSLIANHAFVDGNKRAGLFAALLFLRINGQERDLCRSAPYMVRTLCRLVCSTRVRCARDPATYRSAERHNRHAKEQPLLMRLGVVRGDVHSPIGERDQRLLTVPAAGRRVGAGRGLAYKMARDGRLPVFKVGRKLFVRAVDLEKLIAAA